MGAVVILYHSILGATLVLPFVPVLEMVKILHGPSLLNIIGRWSSNESWGYYFVVSPEDQRRSWEVLWLKNALTSVSLNRLDLLILEWSNESSVLLLFLWQWRWREVEAICDGFGIWLLPLPPHRSLKCCAPGDIKSQSMLLILKEATMCSRVD